MTESRTVKVDVKVASGAMAALRVLSALLVFGGVGVIAWVAMPVGTAGAYARVALLCLAVIAVIAAMSRTVKQGRVKNDD